MNIVINALDLKQRTLSLSMASLKSDSDWVLLTEYLKQCDHIGIKTVDVILTKSQYEEINSRLYELIKSLKTTSNLHITVSQEHEYIERQCECVRFSCNRSNRIMGDNSGSLQYSIQTTILNSLLDDISRYVRLIAHSIQMDSRALSNLRLCIYELAANTVDHASFQNEKACVRVDLDIKNNSIFVTYRDNADSFKPNEEIIIDFENKIESRSRRGLGLYLLKQLTTNLSYKRDEGWNRTSFELPALINDNPVRTGGQS